MHHYPFHPGDYIKDTVHLTLEEDATYRRALDHYYDTEAPLASDKQTLSKRLRVSEQTLSAVLAEFFIETPEGWRHKRCDEEIARYKAKSEKAKRAGSLGGLAKSSGRLANAKQTPSKRLANQNQEPEPEPEPSNKPLPLRASLDAQQLEVGSWFGRRASTQWSAKELTAWKAIHPDDLAEGIEILKAPYTAKAKFCRKDLKTLLNNWTGEIDRWRNYQPPASSDVTNRQTTEQPGFLDDDNAIFHHPKS